MTEKDPELIEKIKRQLAADAPRVDTNSAWSGLKQRIEAASPRPDITPLYRAPASERRWHSNVWRIAAAIAILAGAGVVWQQWHASQRTTLIAPLASTTEATLPDGSKIVLAPGSQLSWRNDFGASDREVVLQGEGYFDVIHHAEHPFTVRARHAVARDIGTRFAVRAWNELTNVEVSVEEGIVELGDTTANPQHEHAQLIAGQKGSLALNGAIVIETGVGASLAWRTGDVVFENTPLAEALPVLERWYDVELRASPALAGRRITARFNKQSLPDLLQALSLALSVRTERTGRLITLIPNSP